MLVFQMIDQFVQRRDSFFARELIKTSIVCIVMLMFWIEIDNLISLHAFCICDWDDRTNQKRFFFCIDFLIFATTMKFNCLTCDYLIQTSQISRIIYARSHLVFVSKQQVKNDAIASIKSKITFFWNDRNRFEKSFFDIDFCARRRRRNLVT